MSQDAPQELVDFVHDVCRAATIVAPDGVRFVFVGICKHDDLASGALISSNLSSPQVTAKLLRHLADRLEHGANQLGLH